MSLYKEKKISQTFFNIINTNYLFCGIYWFNTTYESPRKYLYKKDEERNKKAH